MRPVGLKEMRQRWRLNSAARQQQHRIDDATQQLTHDADGLIDGDTRLVPGYPKRWADLVEQEEPLW